MHSEKEQKERLQAKFQPVAKQIQEILNANNLNGIIHLSDHETDVMNFEGKEVPARTAIGCVIVLNNGISACLVEEKGLRLVNSDDEPDDKKRFHKLRGTYETCNALIEGNNIISEKLERLRDDAKGHLFNRSKGLEVLLDLVSFLYRNKR